MREAGGRQSRPGERLAQANHLNGTNMNSTQKGFARVGLLVGAAFDV